MSIHLYFSQKCPVCTKLIGEINKVKGLPQMITAHKHGAEKFPSAIKEVPSVYVVAPNGRTALYGGTDCFIWLQEVTAPLGVEFFLMGAASFST